MKKGLSGLVRLVDEAQGLLGDLVVDGLHALLRQRTRVLDVLLANMAPARLLGRIVPSVAQQWSTPRGPKHFLKSGILG